METPLQPPPLPRPHNNQRLFSDHYLDVTLPSLPSWQHLIGQSRLAMEKIATILAHFTPSQNEAQTEKDLVRPVLEALGHVFEVQAALKAPGGTKRPDYVIYPDEAAKNANKDLVLDDEKLATAFAIGEAKYWDRPLDVSLKGKGADSFESRAPASQIAFYMLQGGVRWGILTNGRRWRLYHRDTAHKLDRYYEVDLPALVASGDPGRFLYFYAFFRRAAFDGVDLGLDAILKASAEYSHGVGESLKVQVYDALRHLAQGFFDYPGNGLAPDAETLAAIYDNSLILLYRLLFILYAEARELLPVSESDVYRNSYSLRTIAGDVARDLDRGIKVLPNTQILWPRLRALFQLIDRGEPTLKLATFDGGLFDPERHPFLERYVVGDAHLRLAIDCLARVDRHFVDYRDLAERHLGAIYEGLLEFHLTPIEPEDNWTVALVNDKGERKATGSYYTPDYIVKYIVEQAVGPVLRAAVEGKRTDREKIEAIFGVRVLDPAMGSGHFPVEVTEYIARFLIDQAVDRSDGAEESDLAYWKRRVAQNCVYGVDLNPLAVDLAKLSLWLATAAKDKPLSFLDHHLRPGNALVGAWTSDLRDHLPTSASKKKATRKAEQQEAAGQLSMLDEEAFRQSMSTAVGWMERIEHIVPDRLVDVKEQERAYLTLREALHGKFERLADLATATHFGVAIDPKLMKPLADYLTGGGFEVPRFKAWIDQIREADERYSFFHWELEFPEVFFDHHGQPLGEQAGFDAVVGNPPYVRQEGLSDLKPYFAAAFPDVYHGVADLFVYFFGQGMRLLRDRGRLGYVSSDSWLRANYATRLRAFLRTRATVESIVDLGDNHIFADAPDVYPAIPIVRRGPPPPDHAASAAVFPRGEGISSFSRQLTEKQFSVIIRDQPDAGWQLEVGEARSLFAKIIRAGRPLEDVVPGRIYRGVLTGLNEAFIVDRATRDRLIREDPASAHVLKRIYRGEDLRPWYQEDEDRWAVAIPCGWTRSRCGPDTGEDAWRWLTDALPAIAGHLAPFAERARRRQDKGDFWWELRPCDYYAEFEKPKILWPDIAKLPRFSRDGSGSFIGNTAYMLITDDYSMLGLLNSRCTWYFITHASISLGERAGANRYRLFDQYLRRVPIPDAPAHASSRLRELAAAITSLARERYTLHRKARHRVLADLGKPGRHLNQKLTAWWTLDFLGFSDEVRHMLGTEIPIKQRDEWEAWLTEGRARHESLTEEIVRRETELNALVYGLFDLDSDEIALIEQSTKYRYGEV